MCAVCRHFADAAVDIGVIETGMGGTNDATNVFTSDTLALSVITPLGKKSSMPPYWLLSKC